MVVVKTKKMEQEWQLNKNNSHTKSNKLEAKSKEVRSICIFGT